MKETPKIINSNQGAFFFYYFWNFVLLFYVFCIFITYKVKLIFTIGLTFNLLFIYLSFYIYIKSFKIKNEKSENNKNN